MIATKYRAEKDKVGGKPKVVFMLSTCHQPIKETYREIHRKPQAVKAYNSHMGGVDRVDQQLHGLQSLRKSYKWYKKLAFRLISQAFLNGFKLYQRNENRNNYTFLDFVRDSVFLFFIK